MRSSPAPRRLGRATVLTGFAGLAVLAGGAGIAAATTSGDTPAATDVGYGVVVDAPTTAPSDSDCPWADGAGSATDTSLAGAR